MAEPWRPNPPSPLPIGLACPKCRGEMATWERSGIHIDQCRECRGIYLDRGELERLIDLEGTALAAMRVADRRDGPWRPDDDDDDDDDRFERLGDRGRDIRGGDRGRDIRGGERRPASRRRSFLGELFEGFGE